ncbi:hypothetical protein SprV_0702455800 [Sparganum proliferum]
MLCYLVCLLSHYRLPCGNRNEVEIPGEFTASALNSSAVLVTWSKPTSSGGLSDLYKLGIFNETYERSYDVRKTRDVITGLQPSTTYNLTVRAVRVDSTPVQAAAFTSVKTWPPEVEIPGEFTASALNSSAVLVTWSKPTSSGGLSDLYKLGIFNETYERSYDVRKTRDVITGLQPSTTYNLTVRAVRVDSTPVQAAAFTSVKTWPPEVEIPGEFTASALNSSAVLVTWSKPTSSGGLSDLYKLGIFNETYERSYDVRKTRDVITGLQPSTTYNLTVRAVRVDSTPVQAAAFTSVKTWPPVALSVAWLDFTSQM